MEPKKDSIKPPLEEESKNSVLADASKSELQRLREIEKAQHEKMTKLRGQIAIQEQMIDKLRRENEKIKDKVKSVVVSTREAELEMALRLSQIDTPASRGLTEYEIDTLPLFNLDDSIDCGICKKLIPEEHIVKSLPLCGHIFHQPCIDNYLLSHKTCPECLTPALED